MWLSKTYQLDLEPLKIISQTRHRKKNNERGLQNSCQFSRLQLFSFFSLWSGSLLVEFARVAHKYKKQQFKELSACSAVEANEGERKRRVEWTQASDNKQTHFKARALKSKSAEGFLEKSLVKEFTRHAKKKKSKSEKGFSSVKQTAAMIHYGYIWLIQDADVWLFNILTEVFKYYHFWCE